MAFLEVCCGDLQSVHAAAAGGAARVELCAGLESGGLTPSDGFIACALKVQGIRKHVLIRPREGDFVYSAEEVEAMLRDIAACRRLGADGVVIGALMPDGSVDRRVCDMLIAEAAGMSVTFHRAFDLCSDPDSAMDYLISRGVDRILTSGLEADALRGVAELARLQHLAGDRLIIMPGCGVSPSNAAEILRATGCREIHASARKSVPSTMVYRRESVSMGAPGSDEYSRKTTDADTVRAIVSAIETLNNN